MNQEYFDKVTELEKMNASDQYILGCLLYTSDAADD